MNAEDPSFFAKSPQKLSGLPLRHFCFYQQLMQLRAARSGPLNGVADIPGDKSCSHRALILGALAEGETRISELLVADDVAATARAVEAFGAKVERDGTDWRVSGAQWRSPARPIDCGNSGTAARLLMGAAAGFGLSATFTGDASLSRRPMGRVTAPLSRMGARFEGADRLPVTVEGGGLAGIDWLNEPPSAQVKTAILLAGLSAAGPVIVRETAPSRDHGEIMLRQFGCEVASGDGLVRLGKHRRLTGRDIAIAADPSSAAFALMAAAVIPGSCVEVRDMLANPLRTGFLEELAAMGAEVQWSGRHTQSGEEVASVRVRHAPLGPVDIAAERIPTMIDEVPLLAVAAAYADGETVIRGLGELRHKESDRLKAIVSGLAACGVTARADGDNLRIIGQNNVAGGAKVAALGDHRIAMAFLVLGLASEEPVAIDSAGMIATSFPGFAETMRALGADIR